MLERLTMMKSIALIILFVSAAPVLAADRPPYGNARFGYWIEIPNEFSNVVESGNGDGGVARGRDGRTKLLIWGLYPENEDFSKQVDWEINQAKEGGLNVTYQQRLPRRAVWSGVKNGRITYQQIIPACRGSVATFVIEYDQNEKRKFDPVISKLARSFKKGTCD